jgi:YVTN family beta-propeller protein
MRLPDGSRLSIVVPCDRVRLDRCLRWRGGTRDTHVDSHRDVGGTPLLEVIARVPVGAEQIGIVEGFGSIWVVNSEFDGGGTPSVSRIDPATASVEATIPVGAVPLEAAAAFDAVWVSNSEDDTITRIDPATNEVAATIGVCGAPEGMAADEDGLWVVCEESGEVVRVDPATNRGEADPGWSGAPIRDRGVRQRVGLQLPRSHDHAARPGDG